MGIIREWEREQTVFPVVSITNTASNNFKLTVITQTAKLTRLWCLFCFPLGGYDSSKSSSPSVSTYSITPFPFQPLHALRVSLICFIPSNLASAVPPVPLLAVCVWKIEGCLCLGVCLVSNFIQSDVVTWFWIVLFSIYMCVCLDGVYLCIWTRCFVCLMLMEMLLCVVSDWLFSVFRSWLLGQSHM